MLEGRDRTATAIRSQSGHRGALEKEGQQFSACEDACYQLAILEVVARQSRFVLGEHAIDFRHALVGIVDGLAFTQKGLGDVLQAKGGEAPRSRAKRLDAINDQAPGSCGEIMIAATAVLAPFHLRTAAPQTQRHLQALRMIAQHAQIELH